MRHKLLYVDDEPINLKLLQISFRNEYEVITAISAEEGMSILEKDPDIPIIISDMKMPSMDGLEFIKTVKHQYKDKICILLTGYMESEVMLEGLNEELIFRYIIKPWKKNELGQIIDEALARISHQ